MVQGVEVLGISMVQGVEVLAIIEIPQHGLGILAAGSAEGTVRGHGDGVQVASVTNVVGLQLAGLVPCSGDNLPVVGREGDGKHILGVVLEPAGGLAGGEVPQPQGLVPGARQSKVSVRGKNHVRYEMAVTMQTLLRDAVVSNIIPGELPDDERLVPG